MFLLTALITNYYTVQIYCDFSSLNIYIHTLQLRPLWPQCCGGSRVCWGDSVMTIDRVFHRFVKHSNTISLHYTCSPIHSFSPQQGCSLLILPPYWIQLHIV